MSNLQELINKTIHDIQFNGCNLPESIIRLQLDNIAACAKLEEAIERNNTYLESFKLDSAHGNGANDRPNVIGDCITEPEQVGRWYKCTKTNTKCFTLNKWYFSKNNNPLDPFGFYDNYNISNGWGIQNGEHFDLTNPQLNNPDAEPTDYVNPITN